MDKVHSINLDVPVISVVAPVYKVEPFLQECIDSVLNQSFTNFELILVDDGSPDKCGEICDKATEKDSRIRVFHQENGGVSSARKLGVDNAKGEWICFIDADDRLLPNALQDLITACDTLGYNIDDFDLIEGGHDAFRINEKTWEKEKARVCGVEALHKKRGTVIVNGFEYAKEIASHTYFFNPAIWEKIIRHSLLIETDALNTPRNFFHGEDTMADFKLSKKIRKALRIQNIVYEYNRNSKGVCSSTKDIVVTFDYTSSWWNSVKETFNDMPEEWQEVYKIVVAKTFLPRFIGAKGKTWKLFSPEFKPYLEILKEKRNLIFSVKDVIVMFKKTFERLHLT